MTEVRNTSAQQIIFFDGICHLCNGFVDFVIQNETGQGTRFVFAPLQGETAQQYLHEKARSSLDSVLLWKNGDIYRESEAVIQILSQLQSPWRALAFAIRLFPSKIRNWVYRWVARHRLQWFGQRQTCRLPQAHERNYLWP